MIQFNKHNERLLIVNYYITMFCNNRCEYCFQMQRLETKNRVNDDVFEQLVYQITQFVNNTDYKVRLNILGGDPLSVYDKTYELVKRLQHPNIDVVIHTNLNYPSNGQAIRRLVDLCKSNRIHINVSWHSVSSVEHIKRNLVALSDVHDNISVQFLMEDSTINEVYSNFAWVQENTKYKIRACGVKKDSRYTFTQWEDPSYIKMSDIDIRDNEDFFMIDDVAYTIMQQGEYNITDLNSFLFQYSKMCHMTGYSVDIDGNVTSSCDYKYKGHISGGFPINDVFCSGKYCSCNDVLYKKLIKKHAKNI